MTSYDVPPRFLVDRDKPQQLLEAMLADMTSERAQLLVITDRQWEGKSLLLGKLRLNCSEVHQVHALLMDLEPVSSVFEAIEQLRDAEQGFEDVLREVAPTYLAISDARLRQDYDAFERLAGRQTDAALNVAHLGSSQVHGGVVAGSASVYNAPVTQVMSSGGDRSPLTIAQQLRIQSACIEAFEKDLRAFSAKRPLVLIFDHADRATATVQAWLDDRVVGRLCFAEHAPPQLRLVLAARPGSMIDRYTGPRVAVQRTSLEPMDDLRLVEDLLRVNNLFPDGMDVDLVHFVYAKLTSRTWSVGQAVKAVRGQQASARLSAQDAP